VRDYKTRKATESNAEKGELMSTARDSRQGVVERVKRDPAFATALLDEAITLFLNGEHDTARIVYG